MYMPDGIMVCTFNVSYLYRDRGRWSCALAHWNRTAEYKSADEESADKELADRVQFVPSS